MYSAPPQSRPLRALLGVTCAAILLAAWPAAADIITPKLQIKPRRDRAAQRARALRARQAGAARLEARAQLDASLKTADRAHLVAGARGACASAVEAAAVAATPTRAAAERFKTEVKAKPTPRTVRVTPQEGAPSGHGCSCRAGEGSGAAGWSALVGLGLVIVARRGRV